MKQCVIAATRDEDAGVWCARNDEIPLATEAPSFDDLVERVMAIAPEIIVMNGLGPAGTSVEIVVSAEHRSSLILPTA